MNIPTRYGRAFEERDRTHGVAVLSEKAAKLLWPAESNPVGRRFIGEDDKLKTLVGIVVDVRGVLDRDPPPMAYYPTGRSCRAPFRSSFALPLNPSPPLPPSARLFAVKTRNCRSEP